MFPTKVIVTIFQELVVIMIVDILSYDSLADDFISFASIKISKALQEK